MIELRNWQLNYLKGISERILKSNSTQKDFKSKQDFLNSLKCNNIADKLISELFLILNRGKDLVIRVLDWVWRLRGLRLVGIYLDLVSPKKN